MRFLPRTSPGCWVDGEYMVAPLNQAEQHRSTEQDEPKEQESAQVQPLVVMQTLSLPTTSIPGRSQLVSRDLCNYLLLMYVH